MDRSPRLTWSEAGAPRSDRFDDIYFSREDGLAETRMVFLEGCGLPERWRSRRRFVVGELGFGTGLNIAALIDLWVRTRPPDGRLHIFSVEGFPLTRDEAARALAAWPELRDATTRLLRQWPQPTPGFHRLTWPDIGVTLDLAVGDVSEMLEAWSGQADAWFLDGFAPSTNPDMWSDRVLDLITARSAPGARVATFTVAGAVRRGLSARGFAVEKRLGHGRKRERLEATLTGIAHEPPMRRVAVVGAGVAGASAARALAEMGLETVLYEQEAAGAGASGFPSALVTPRLDAGDADLAALFAQALSRAGALYRQAKAVIREGVLQLESAPRDAARFAKIADQPWWAAGSMQPMGAATCTAIMGEAAASGGLMMRDALAIRPAAALERWLDTVTIRPAEVASIVADEQGWRLLDATGDDLDRVDAVVVACGWGAARLLPQFLLAPVRGQADWIEGPGAPPTAWGGYVSPTSEGVLFGATHERGETEPMASDAATARNLAQLATRFPTLAGGIQTPTRRRVAIRATTGDRLPLAGAVPGRKGLFILGGLGSRGFCLAPLLSEHVASLIAEAPSPLPGRLSARIDPARFSN